MQQAESKDQQSNLCPQCFFHWPVYMRKLTFRTTHACVWYSIMSVRIHTLRRSYLITAQRQRMSLPISKNLRVMILMSLIPTRWPNRKIRKEFPSLTSSTSIELFSSKSWWNSTVKWTTRENSSMWGSSSYSLTRTSTSIRWEKTNKRWNKNGHRLKSTFKIISNTRESTSSLVFLNQYICSRRSVIYSLMEWRRLWRRAS